MQGTHQQAYDRGTTIFSPDGRLYQVEYAREAVNRGAPVVGVRGADALVLAAHVARRSPLVDPGSVEKLSVVDEHVVAASAGHAADGRQLVDVARRAAQTERVRFGEATTVESLSTAVANHVQEHTQTGSARPYGTALLLAGYDRKPRLFETDPSGATSEWHAAAIGRGADDVVEYFEERYQPTLTAEAVLTLALEGLDSVIDELESEDVEAVRIDEDGFASVPGDRLGTVLDGIE